MYTTASGIQIPQGTDSFSPTAQFKDWADGEAVFDNFLNVNLDSERTALTAPKLRDGVFCWVRATKTLWRYEGTTWVVETEPWTAATLASGITATAGRLTPQYRRVGKGVEVVGTIDGTSGSTYTLLTLPAGFAPAGVAQGWASAGGFVQMETNGVLNSSLTGTKTSVAFSIRYPVA